jgi:hypothetical protein
MTDLLYLRHTSESLGELMQNINRSFKKAGFYLKQVNYHRNLNEFDSQGAIHFYENDDGSALVTCYECPIAVKEDNLDGGITTTDGRTVNMLSHVNMYDKKILEDLISKHVVRAGLKIQIKK